MENNSNHIDEDLDFISKCLKRKRLPDLDKKKLYVSLLNILQAVQICLAPASAKTFNQLFETFKDQLKDCTSDENPGINKKIVYTENSEKSLKTQNDSLEVSKGSSVYVSVSEEDKVDRSSDSDTLDEALPKKYTFPSFKKINTLSLEKNETTSKYFGDKNMKRKLLTNNTKSFLEYDKNNSSSDMSQDSKVKRKKIQKSKSSRISSPSSLSQNSTLNEVTSSQNDISNIGDPSLFKHTPRKAKKRGFWSFEDELKFVKLVHEIGEGNWAEIKKKGKFDKTNVQLKDKWRNLIRNGKANDLKNCLKS